MELNRTKVIKIAEKDYTVKFPTVGQIMDIEQRKQILTASTYGAMVRTITRSSVFTLELVDAISCFTVLLPELSKDLDVKSYLDMDAFQGRELVKVYNEDFRPWFQPFLKELYKDMDEEVEEVEKEEEEPDKA